MIFEIERGEYVCLSTSVERVISAFLVEPEIGLEAGGILIGSYRGPHVEVRGCTAPLPGDRRGPRVFDRRDPGHQAAATWAWRSGYGTETFVGEWHTHPQDDPEPSGLDRSTWWHILARRSDPVVFLIGGRRSLWCGLGRDGIVRRVRPIL